MKDFYDFLNGHNGWNFVGFLLFTGIVVTGLREIVAAAIRNGNSNQSKSNKQQLND